MTNVETLSLAGGYSYDLAIDDATVANGDTLTIDASTLGAGDTLGFDGSAETGGTLVVTGGAGNDTIGLGAGGHDMVHTGGGSNTVNAGSGLDAGDIIDGTGGVTLLTLDGDYSGGLTLGAATLSNILRVTFAGGHSYDLTTDDGNVATGKGMLIYAAGLRAGDGLTFDGSAETDGHFAFYDGAGDDALTGGARADTFTMAGGGADTVSGGGGDDIITFIVPAFSAGTSVDGGSGTDTLVLNGGTDAVFGPGGVVNVERIDVRDDLGQDFHVTSDDTTVGAGETVIVDATALAPPVTTGRLSFDGSAETDGHFAFLGGANGDVLTGGALSDTFDFTHGGDETAHGGGGDDNFTFGAAFTGADSVDGGAGNDTVTLDGEYGGPVVFGAATMTNVETVIATAGHNYWFVPNAATVTGGQTMTFNGSALAGNSFVVDGSAVTDGHLKLIGGGATAANYGGGLYGGALSDEITVTSGSGGGGFTIKGGGGADKITLSTNYSTTCALYYDHPGDSTGTDYDTITGFHPGSDHISIAPPHGTFDGVFSGAVNSGTLDDDIEAAVDGQLTAGDTCQVFANGGDLVSAYFLVVDANGDGAYTAGSDYLIRLDTSLSADDIY